MIKKYELLRDRNLAKQRLRGTYKALSKHELSGDDKYWGWIPKTVFELDLSPKALGLLVILAMNANTLPVSSGRKVVARLTAVDVLNMLGLRSRNQSKTIRELLDELAEVDLINNDDEFIQLNFPTMDKLTKDTGVGFAKIYTSTYKDILSKSHGMVTLNRLALYLGIRSNIFEGEKGGPTWQVIFHSRGITVTGEKVGMTSSTARKQLQWFIDNEVLAWNLVQNHNKYHNKHYYLTEHFNVDTLALDICVELECGDLLRVLK